MNLMWNLGSASQIPCFLALHFRIAFSPVDFVNVSGIGRSFIKPIHFRFEEF